MVFRDEEEDDSGSMEQDQIVRDERHVLRAGASYVSKGAQWMDSLVPPMNYSRAGVLMWSRRYPAYYLISRKLTAQNCLSFISRARADL